MRTLMERLREASIASQHSADAEAAADELRAQYHRGQAEAFAIAARLVEIAESGAQ